MKKVLLAIMALLSVVAVSCEKNPENGGGGNEPAELNVEKLSFSVDKGDGTLDVLVSSNTSVKAVVSADAREWLYYLQTKAITSSTIVLGYHANPLPTVRSGKVTLTAGDKQTEITVTQAAGDPSISIDPTSKKVNPAGEVFTVTVTCNDDVRFNSNVSWLRLKSSSGSVYEIEADLNDTGADRNCDAIFSCVSNASIKASLAVTQSPANTDPNSLSILSIGDDFSVDAMHYLYPVLQELGYTTICLGDLVIDKGSLENQSKNFSENAAVYTYYSNKNGHWVSTEKVAPVTVLQSEYWDYIVLQQEIGLSGISDSYEPFLTNLVAEVRKHCSTTPLVWHMTWAYQGNSDRADFAKYGNEQEEMYNYIVNAVQSKIGNKTVFDRVIPSGTAVQNLRTTFMGDNLTRDGYRLTENIGRPLTSLLWAKILTGKGINQIVYTPDDTKDGELLYKYEEDYLPAMKEAVNNAADNPFVVTVTTDFKPDVMKFDNPTAAQRIMTDNGLNPSDYTELQLPVMHNAYWYSTESAGLYVAFLKATGSELNKWSATERVPKNALPPGTLIILKDGYCYCPEGWTSLSKYSGTRPVMVSQSLVVVDGAWWGDFNYRAFNIGSADGRVLTLAEQKTLNGVLGIYVPKSAIDVGGLEDYLDGTWSWD